MRGWWCVAGLPRADTRVPLWRTALAGLAGLALLLVVSLGNPAPALAVQKQVCKDRNLALGASNTLRVERALLCLTNRLRAINDRPMLLRDTRLSAAARRHSRDMVDRNYFAHQARNEPGSPAPHGVTPPERAQAAGWPTQFVGENIAMSFPATAGALFDLWRKSPGHRQNILSDDYATAGFGVVRSGQGVMGTQKFADEGADTNDRAANLLVDSKRCRTARLRLERTQRRLRRARRQGAPKRRVKNRRAAVRQARKLVNRRC